MCFSHGRMFSHWMEALPGKQDTAFTVDQVLLEKIIPISSQTPQ